MKRTKPKRYNYSYLILSLLPLLCGPLSYHVNIINAVAGCSEFSNDKCRYFSLTDSHYREYLSDMKNEKRNPTTAMKQLFSQGSFEGYQHQKPSAEKFTDIAFEFLIFKYEVYEMSFRNDISDILTNGQNSHMKQSEIDNLLHSAKEDDIYTFIFKCFQTVIMCNSNTAQRKTRKSDLEETLQNTLCEVEKLTAAEKDVLRNPREDYDEDECP